MRTATVERATRETTVRLELVLEGEGKADIRTGVSFLDHMLRHVAMHGLFDLRVEATGDTDVDDHHTTEDVGIVLGQALHQALADRAGIERYGHAVVPMDEALALVAVDLSGRGCLAWDVMFPAERIGAFATELVQEFMQALAREGRLTLHVRVFGGQNAHHIAEAIFKALGRALGLAVHPNPRRAGIASTKGTL